jgi:hypothetical protein
MNSKIYKIFKRINIVKISSNLFLFSKVLDKSGETGSIFINENHSNPFCFLGTIEFEEYLSFMLTFIKKNVTTEENLRDAFILFDQDSDGLIDTTDLREIMTNLGEKITDEDLDEMIREADIGTYYLVLYRRLFIK